VPNINGPLYYERMGRTGPVMAFVHPNPMDQSCWIYQMARFSTWFRCVAIDIPGSAAEKILQWVRLVISIALFAAMFTTTGMVAWNVAEKAKELKLQPLELWQSGVTFVVIVGSSMLLLVFAHLIDESKRRYVYAGGLVGLLGSCACFVWLGPLDDSTEPIAMFFGSTITAIAMLILMNLSGFKAK